MNAPVHEDEPVNVAAHLARLAASQPDTLSVAVAEGGTFVELSAAELASRTRKTAAALRAAGIERGMRTVLMVPPGPEFFALTFALFEIGAVLVMVDPGMGVKNLGTCLGEARPEAFVGVAKAHVARLLFGWARGSLRIKIGVGTRMFGRSLAGLKKRVSADDEAAACDPKADELAAVLFTSGSTGVPKGAEYTHGMFSSQVRLLRAVYDIRPGERDLSTFPLFALFGPALGMASVVPDMDASRPGRADPARLVEAARRYECSSMFANPALIDKLGRWAEASGAEPIATLSRVISAGAPSTPAALRRFSKLMPPGCTGHTPYGATEALPVANVQFDLILGETAARTEAGEGVCVGTPVDGIEVAIIEIDDDAIETWTDARPCEVGALGEICVKGPVASRAYFGREASTRAAKISDGEGFWHRMGDVGRFDAQGRLWMCGRKSHRVRVDEKTTMFTVPTEAPFCTDEGVRRAALVGVGEPGAARPVLCVELEPGANFDEVRPRLDAIAAQDPLRARIEDILPHPKFPVDVRHNAKIHRESLALWATERLQ